MCVYVYMYVCMYVCVYVNDMGNSGDLGAQEGSGMHATHVLYMYIHVCICICMYVCMYVYM
jgi:hypothetical protein